MEWLNEPGGMTPRDACPIYLCLDRQTDSQSPCLIQACGKKFCFWNK